MTTLAPAPKASPPAPPAFRRSAAWVPWVTFLLRRLASLVMILAGLVLAAFLLVRLVPGDPARAVAGLDASPESVERIRAELGLDQALPNQFVEYVGGLFRGDLGTSFQTSEPVSTLIGQRLSVSGPLAGYALAVVLLVSIGGGLLAAVLTRDDRHRGIEAGFTGVTSLGSAIPEFLMATFLAAVFGVWLQVLPVAGYTGLVTLILPIAAVAIRPTFILARIVRVETLNALAQEYVRTARSKRLSERRIYLRHVLPNVLTAALAVGGVVFANLIAGAVLVESVFSLPGLGTALVNGVITHDYPVVQGVVLMLGASVVIVNAVVDVLLGIVDPRSMTRVG